MIGDRKLESVHNFKGQSLYKSRVEFYISTVTGIVLLFCTSKYSVSGKQVVIVHLIGNDSFRLRRGRKVDIGRFEWPHVLFLLPFIVHVLTLIKYHTIFRKAHFSRQINIPGFNSVQSSFCCWEVVECNTSPPEASDTNPMPMSH